MSLYTDQELIDKIKELNVQLDGAVTKSSIDTTQTKNEVSISVRTIREQRQNYMVMLQQQNRSLFNQCFGSSARRFKGRYRGED